MRGGSRVRLLDNVTMKEVYLVLTHTGTTLSNIVKFYTKKDYTHVSISLDSELKRLYSFGRLNPNNPFKAGFVREDLETGTFAIGRPGSRHNTGKKNASANRKNRKGSVLSASDAKRLKTVKYN